MKKILIIDLAGRSHEYNKSLIKGLKLADVQLDYCNENYNSEFWSYKRYIPQPHGPLFKATKFINLYFNHTRLYKALLGSSEKRILHFQWLPLMDKVSIDLKYIRKLKDHGHKLIFTIHNLLPHDSGEKRIESFRKLYAHFDELICHSENIKNDLIYEYGIKESSVSVIRHGYLLFDPVQENIKAESIKEVLFFGHLRPYKGIEFLIKSWKILARENGNLRLSIIGKASKKFESHLQELSRGIENITLHNRFLTNEELKQNIRKSQLVIFPYKAITTSGAVTAAMAAGKPCILTSLDTFKDEFQQVAKFVDFNDIEGLAEAILELANNPELSQRLAHACQKLMMEKFNWECIGLETKKLYFF